MIFTSVFQLLCSFFDDKVLQGSRSDNSISPDVIDKKGNTNKVIIPEKYSADIKALEDYIGGPLTTGLSIKMTLQEILAVVPRKRKRTDAYMMLVRFLKDEMNVDLEITGRQNKQLKGKGTNEKT